MGFLGLPKGTPLKRAALSPPSTHVRVKNTAPKLSVPAAPSWSAPRLGWSRSFCDQLASSLGFQGCLKQHLDITYLTGNQTLLVNFAHKDALSGKEKGNALWQSLRGTGWLIGTSRGSLLKPSPGRSRGLDQHLWVCGVGHWGQRSKWGNDAGLLYMPTRETIYLRMFQLTCSRCLRSWWGGRA